MLYVVAVELTPPEGGDDVYEFEFFENEREAELFWGDCNKLVWFSSRVVTNRGAARKQVVSAQFYRFSSTNRLSAKNAIDGGTVTPIYDTSNLALGLPPFRFGGH